MTAHSTSQAARYTAIVFAGATSLTLTVAAGAYVVSQMVPGTSTTSPGAVLALPDRAVTDAVPRIAWALAADPPAFPAPPSFAVGGSSRRVLPAFAGPASDTPASDIPASGNPAPGLPATDEPAAADPAAEPPTGPRLALTPVPGTDRGGQLDLGVAAAQSQRDERRTTFTLTVDPEVSAAVHRLFGDAPAATAGPTLLSTEIDREGGGFAVGFSDPVLGERTVEVPPAAQPEQSTGATPA